MSGSELPHIAPEWREQWRQDCQKWRGRVLTGTWSHWCDDWDGLPIDETTPEWPCACLAAPTAREVRRRVLGVRK